MITAEQATYLIGLPKKFVKDDEILERIELAPKRPFVDRHNMLSEDDDQYSFLLVANQSKKRFIKFTLYLIEDGVNLGLLRVDYFGRHKNPEIANEHVPESFKPFTAKWLDDYPGHIHYVVDGYAPLQWAIPLEIDDFPVKQIDSFTDITFSFTAFCKKINVQTKLEVNTQSDAFL